MRRDRIRSYGMNVRIFPIVMFVLGLVTVFLVGGVIWS